MMYLFFYKTEIYLLIPAIISFNRIGIQMSFNIGYISMAKLFPTHLVSSAMGIVNFMAHVFTVGAPLVAETSEPIPFVVYSLLAFVALFVSQRLVEV